MLSIKVKVAGYGLAILLVLFGAVVRQPHHISTICTLFGALIGLGLMFVEYIAVDPDMAHHHVTIDEVYDNPTTVLSLLLRQTPRS